MMVISKATLAIGGEYHEGEALNHRHGWFFDAREEKKAPGQPVLM